MSRHQTHHRSTPAQPPRFVLRPMVLAVHLAMVGGVVIGAGWADKAHAQQAAPAMATSPRHYDIPAGPLNTVLVRFLSESGVLLSGSTELARGKSSPGVKGSFAPGTALAALLTGTGLEAVADAQGRYTLHIASVATVPPSTVSAPTAGVVTLPEVKVVGRNAGASDLPEEYAGGQVARGSQLGFLGNADFLDSPFSTIAYTSSFMQAKGAQRLSDVIGLTDPSVEFDRVNGYAEQISIRGFAAAAQDITYGGLYGVLPSMRIYPEIAERIEVIKGPAALLNGMMPDDSVGGTVNMVPKRAGAEPMAQVTTTYMSHSHVGGHVDVGQRFGQDKSLGVRFNGAYRSGESEIARQDKQVGLGALGLDWVGTGVRISADIIANRERADGFGYWGFYGDLLGGGVPKPPNPLRLINSPDSYYRTQDTAVVTRAEFDLTPDWLAYVAFGGRRSRFESLANHIDINDMAGNTTDGWFYWKTKSTTLSGLAGLRGKFRTGDVSHEFNLNMTGYRNKSASLEQGFFDNPYASNIYNLTYSTPPDVSALRAENYVPSARETLRSVGVADTLSFAGGKFRLTMGVRQQYVHADNQDGKAAYAANALSPSLAGVWALSPVLAFYANYSTGLSSGGTAPSDAANPGKVLPPIRTKQHEVGLKTDLGDWAVTLSYFQIEKPTADYHPVTNVWGVVGDTRNRGIELTTMGEPVKGLRVLGGVAFNDARYGGDIAGENAGRQVVGIPRQLFKFGVEHDLAAVPGLTITGGAIHSAQQALRANNNAYAPAWTRWDAGVRYSTRWGTLRKLTLRADVQNLTNKGYWLAPAFNGMGAPRTVMLSATFDL